MTPNQVAKALRAEGCYSKGTTVYYIGFRVRRLRGKGAAREGLNNPGYRDITRYMNGTTFIGKLTEVQRTVQHLLDQLEASEHEKFAAHLYQTRREYRHVSERASKGNKAVERCVIRPFRLPRACFLSANFVSGSTCCAYRSKAAECAIFGRGFLDRTKS